MIFKCGTPLMKRIDRYYRRQWDWHRWFAWRPVHIADDLCIWWQYVERKNTGPSCEGGWNEWEYRLPQVEKGGE